MNRLAINKMNQTGTWGIDQEIFLAALILKTDTFVYKDSNCWIKFSIALMIEVQYII